MNDTVTAPTGATRSRGNPKKNSAPSPDRARGSLQAKVDAALDLIEKALADSDTFPYAATLLMGAQDQLRGNLPDATKLEDIKDWIYGAEAQLLGARDMIETPEADAKLIDCALTLLWEARGAQVENNQPTTWAQWEPAQPSEAQLADGGGATIPPNRLRLAAWNFRTLTTIAESIYALSVDLVDRSTDSWDKETMACIQSVQALAQQAGALADIGLVDCGEPLNARHKDPRGWLLPPAYHAEFSKGGAA